MGATGGDVKEIRFKHEDLGDGVFYAVSNQGNTLDVGGFRAADDANMIDGSGSAIWQHNQVRGGFEVLISNDMNGRNDAQVIANLQESTKEADWTIIFFNDTIWGGRGKAVGDVAPDTNASTMTLKVSGGRFTKIAG